LVDLRGVVGSRVDENHVGLNQRYHHARSVFNLFDTVTWPAFDFLSSIRQLTRRVVVIRRISETNWVVHVPIRTAANHVDIPTIEAEFVTQSFAVSIVIRGRLAPCDRGAEGQDAKIERTGTGSESALKIPRHRY
jgi:hypothetical protein